MYLYVSISSWLREGMLHTCTHRQAVLIHKYTFFYSMDRWVLNLIFAYIEIRIYSEANHVQVQGNRYNDIVLCK